MDETVFDSLTRTMGNGASRRGVLRAVTGGALTLELGRLALEDVDAKKGGKHRKKHKRRGRNNTQSGPTPAPASDPPPVPVDPEPGTCPAGTFSIEGRCVLPCGAACERTGGTCFTDIEGTGFCGPVFDSCEAIPQACGSFQECGAQEVCAQTICEGRPPAPPTRTRCVPFLA